jgi:hypothetical protein
MRLCRYCSRRVCICVCMRGGEGAWRCAFVLWRGRAADAAPSTYVDGACVSTLMCWWMRGRVRVCVYACVGRTATHNHALSVLAMHLFLSHGLLTAFDLPLNRLRNFFRKIESGYRQNPCTDPLLVCVCVCVYAQCAHGRLTKRSVALTWLVRCTRPLYISRPQCGACCRRTARDQLFPAPQRPARNHRRHGPADRLHRGHRSRL